jgi:hypothetical protein
MHILAMQLMSYPDNFSHLFLKIDFKNNLMTYNLNEIILSVLKHMSVFSHKKVIIWQICAFEQKFERNNCLIRNKY